MGIFFRFFAAILLASFLFPALLSAQTLPMPMHIVIVIMENHAYAEIIGSPHAPYIKSLCADPHAAVFTNYHGVEHPSQPNYLDIFSGQNQGVTDDDVPANYPFTTPNLAADLIGASRSFITYAEGMPETGYDGPINNTANGRYARKHNPCANWIARGVPGPNQLPASVSQPLTSFPSDFRYTTLPTVCYVIPNLDNDMHNGRYPANIERGDKWINDHLDSLRNWTLTNNTLFIITFDEDDGLYDNVIPTIFYGPMVKGGAYAENLNHYNLLRTIEDMYGLTHAGNAAKVTPIADCWEQ